MDEAQHLADRVAVIAAGRVVAEGPPDTLGDRHRADSTIRFGLPSGAAPPPWFGGFPVGEGRFEVISADATRELHRLTGWALEHGVELQGVEVSRPTLEDVYLELTGGGAGEP
jgi:ABC-2 type transport system ATP-binding protein